MTEQEINVAIALELGWTNIYTGLIGSGGNNPTGKRRNIPDFCNDLNAMWSAEENLTDEQTDSYVNCLVYLTSKHRLHYMDKNLVHATARQRAEAFLKTVGKWKETQTPKGE